MSFFAQCTIDHVTRGRSRKRRRASHAFSLSLIWNTEAAARSNVAGARFSSLSRNLNAGPGSDKPVARVFNWTTHFRPVRANFRIEAVFNPCTRRTNDTLLSITHSGTNKMSHLFPGRHKCTIMNNINAPARAFIIITHAFFVFKCALAKSMRIRLRGTYVSRNEKNVVDYAIHIYQRVSVCNTLSRSFVFANGVRAAGRVILGWNFICN